MDMLSEFSSAYKQNPEDQDGPSTTTSSSWAEGLQYDININMNASGTGQGVAPTEVSRDSHQDLLLFFGENENVVPAAPVGSTGATATTTATATATATDISSGPSAWQNPTLQVDSDDNDTFYPAQSWVVTHDDGQNGSTERTDPFGSLVATSAQYQPASISSSNNSKLPNSMNDILAVNQDLTMIRQRENYPGPTTPQTKQEGEEITLLREIFPDLSTPELQDLHFNHIMASSSAGIASSPHLSQGEKGLQFGTATTNANYQGKDIAVRDEMLLNQAFVQDDDNTNNNNSTTGGDMAPSCPFSSKLGRRLWNEYAQDVIRASHPMEAFPEPTEEDLSWLDEVRQELERLKLPQSFLRLPQETKAACVRNKTTGRLEYMLVNELEQTVLEQQMKHDAQDHEKNTLEIKQTPVDEIMDDDESKAGTLEFSKVLNRGGLSVGLGMTIREWNGCIFVHALVCNDGTRVYSYSDDAAKKALAAGPDQMGPAFMEGILPGDRILGINGVPLLQWQVVPGSISTQEQQSGNAISSHDILKSAAECLMKAPDPVVIHLRRTHYPRRKYFENEQQDNPDDPLQSSTSDDMPTSSGDDLVGLNESTQLDEQEATSSARASKRRGRKETVELPIHPFAKALSKRNLLQNPADEMAVTKELTQYMDRTRQWESTSSFRIASRNFKLRPHFDPKDLPASSTSESHLLFEYENSKIARPYAPSTPTIEPTEKNIEASMPTNSSATSLPQTSIDDEPLRFRGSFRRNNRGASVRKNPESKSADERNEGNSLLIGDPSAQTDSNTSGSERRKNLLAPASKNRRRKLMSITRSVSDTDIFIPLMGVRKALCVRIVNRFLDNDRMAYTIWVYDVESGKEWYAPVRYYKDFKDLRTAISRLSPRACQVPFPTVGWGVFGNNNEASDVASTKLEHYLGSLCALIYTAPLYPNVAEVAVHVQSFLGCDTGLADLDDEEPVMPNHITMSHNLPDKKSDAQSSAELLLKRSIQRYVHRLFLLPIMDQLTTQFITTFKENSLSSSEWKELEKKSRTAQKDHTLTQLEKVQNFLDHVQDLILEGSADELLSIAQRRDFIALRSIIDGKTGIIYKDAIFREAVREQIEIEMYVPLRSFTSRHIVNAWRHDDMEMQFKMEILRNRPQSYFKIAQDDQSPSLWVAASKILNEGVQRSTLPCNKLLAIVDAAKEIFRIHAYEHSGASPSLVEMSSSSQYGNPQQGLGGANSVVSQSSLGADDFLPIFIYCIVGAEIERASALCVLLQQLCEPSKRIGETGYYLASFEAAISHIRELDLAAQEF
eukprot:CAMPEP_0198297898 /NCGR_PEP_ID=MMETSP1449-20131203/38765_1 /TAXON_ID=420275 /ORGANISM="Attheya septentrionalis, Strain CCMP2084" /LENGTH=1294 /DNA_ID=CAMNT_0043999003 /DNA_START=98 /DNA_END=3982 /DNA_ORIENTATION=+